MYRKQINVLGRGDEKRLRYVLLTWLQNGYINRFCFFFFCFFDWIKINFGFWPIVFQRRWSIFPFQFITMSIRWAIFSAQLHRIKRVRNAQSRHAFCLPPVLTVCKRLQFVVFHGLYNKIEPVLRIE